MREAEIIARLAAGDTDIKTMVSSIYAAVDPRLHPAAARSVLAAMIQLVKSGRVAADSPAGLNSRYVLSPEVQA